MRVFIEFDKAGAEWVIVAYLSGDEAMLSVVREGKNPHTNTGYLITGLPPYLIDTEHGLVGDNIDPDLITELRSSLDLSAATFLPRNMSIYAAMKRANYGLNYGLGYKTFALKQGLTEKDSKDLVSLYRTKAYPDIEGVYWKDVKRELQENGRVLENCFGRKIRLLQAWGTSLFDQAYAFKPQSTVSDILIDAMIAVQETDRPEFRGVEQNMQVHDSLLLQLPADSPEQVVEVCQTMMDVYMNPVLSYRGQEFRIGTTAKMGTDWGKSNMIEFNKPEEALGVLERLKDVAV